MRKQARARRAPNRFIVAREKARKNRDPFSYRRRDAKEPTLYVWKQRSMKNDNTFWCPVAVDINDATALQEAGITLEEALAVMKEPTESAIVQNTEEHATTDTSTAAEVENEGP